MGYQGRQIKWEIKGKGKATGVRQAPGAGARSAGSHSPMLAGRMVLGGGTLCPLMSPPPGAACAIREARLGALTPAHAANQPCSALKPALGLHGGTRARGAHGAALEHPEPVCLRCWVHHPLMPPICKGRWQHSHRSAVGMVGSPRAAPRPPAPC